MSHDGKLDDDAPGGDFPEGGHPGGDPPETGALPDEEQSLRGSIELPRVVLGSDEVDRQAPRKRVLPGLVDLRWLSYPAYLACIFGGGIAVDFAIDGKEWAAPPIAIAWVALFFWEWIYGVAYRYRRRLLKYFSLMLVVGLSAALAAFCWDRAASQLVADMQGFTSTGLIERDHVGSLEWAAIFALLSGALITLHAVILGRGWRGTAGHPKERAVSSKQAS